MQYITEYQVARLSEVQSVRIEKSAEQPAITSASVASLQIITLGCILSRGLPMNLGKGMLALTVMIEIANRPTMMQDIQ
ncbi:hypothetical protein FGO68_gene3397 [Halteria grandinella]|uniref:Uncharacterized protein n=1 Tax=Halteria grandinella TaxID=5974 RepID=A0A8J8NFK2_HALGN|nr:hypothetical protein FGO68_gene3397 [Halteria grandinella]